jgi:hypothetical protein
MKKVAHRRKASDFKTVFPQWVYLPSVGTIDTSGCKDENTFWETIDAAIRKQRWDAWAEEE